MILVTGAAGKTGQAILRALARRGVGARAMVHHAQQVAAALENGAAEAVCADYARAEDLSTTLQGVKRVYLICPNMHPDELAISRRMVKAAEAAGVEYFVYHSVLHPQVEAMPHHWNKMRVEEMLFQTGLPYAVTQPCAYMQNIQGYWAAILRDGVYALPYASRTAISVVDLEDVAEAAAAVLCDTNHAYGLYELSGPQALTVDDMAQILTDKIGRSVIAREVERSAWEKNMRVRGMGDYEVSTLLKMFEYYERFHFRGSPRVLESLLGRKARCFSEYIDRVIAGDALHG